jgi:hypothetical protein
MLIEVTGELDFDSRNLILEEDSGARWRLQGAAADGLLIGDRVTVAARKQSSQILHVVAVVEQDFWPLDE